MERTIAKFALYPPIFMALLMKFRFPYFPQAFAIMKVAERSHFPARLWEKIKLDKNMAKAWLFRIDQCKMELQARQPRSKSKEFFTWIWMGYLSSLKSKLDFSRFLSLEFLQNRF